MLKRCSAKKCPLFRREYIPHEQAMFAKVARHVLTRKNELLCCTRGRLLKEKSIELSSDLLNGIGNIVSHSFQQLLTEATIRWHIKYRHSEWISHLQGVESLIITFLHQILLLRMIWEANSCERLTKQTLRRFSSSLFCVFCFDYFESLDLHNNSLSTSKRRALFVTQSFVDASILERRCRTKLAHLNRLI